MCELAPKRWKYQIPTRLLVHPSTRIQIFQGMPLFLWGNRIICKVMPCWALVALHLMLHPILDVSSPHVYYMWNHEIWLNKDTWTIISLETCTLNACGHMVLWNFRLCIEPSGLVSLNRASTCNNLLQLMLANVSNPNNTKHYNICVPMFY